MQPTVRFPSSFRRSALWAALATLGIALAYSDSLHGVFVYDDLPSIVHNPSLSSLWQALHPPGGGGQTVEARPVLNLTLALDYLQGGLSPVSYHFTNLAIHLAAALCLFGIIRRTLKAERFQTATGPDATWIAGSAAILWAVHPLNTESVTYVVQRAESLCGLLILGSLYALIRAASARHPRTWLAVSVASVALGFGCKELTVVALPLLFLFDRTYLAGSFSRAWALRKGYYLGLTATLTLLIASLAATGGNRSGSIGLHTGASALGYLSTQPKALATYFRLSLLPRPLVFDYGKIPAQTLGQMALPAFVVALVLGVAVAAYLRKSPLAYIGAWIFLILAPTSLVPGTTETIVEHRMYLPLAAIVTVAVLGGFAALGRSSLFVWLPVAAALAWMTHLRNLDYRSELALWADTAAKRPLSTTAHSNLGLVLQKQGDLTGARNEFERALEIDDSNADAALNLAGLYAREGRLNKAEAAFGKAIALRPDNPQTLESYAAILAQMGRSEEAKAEYARALALSPADVVALNGLGVVLAASGHYDQAIARYNEALRLDPHDSQARMNLGNALARLGDVPGAVTAYAAAIAEDPANAQAYNNLGVALASQGRYADAVGAYAHAVKINPEFAEAYNNLGSALAQTGHIREAIAQFERAVSLAPGLEAARTNLKQARRSVGP